MDISPTAPEVPSPIDFSDPVQAQAWVEATVSKRPWRPRFFAAFTEALASLPNSPIRIAELGSGPGHLAKAILEGCTQVEHYAAIDFSHAMHDLARVHLGDHVHTVSFEVRDFRSSDWVEGLGQVDVIVTMQAAHEVRHKSRLPRLLKDIYGALQPDGRLLFCDHYAEVGSGKNPDLFPEYAEQVALLKAAGFRDVNELLNEGGMALYQGRKA